MKICAYILAFTVLFLSLKPKFDVISPSSESVQVCCTSTSCSPITENNEPESQQSDNQLPQDTKGICNPFQACCAGFVIAVSTAFSSLPKTGTLPQQYFSYQSPLSSQFISDFWHPPRLV